MKCVFSSVLKTAVFISLQSPLFRTCVLRYFFACSLIPNILEKRYCVLVRSSSSSLSSLISIPVKHDNTKYRPVHLFFLQKHVHSYYSRDY